LYVFGGGRMLTARVALTMELAALKGAKGEILRLLRSGERTAEELAQPLEVTPNAVRFHLAELARDGLVEQRPVRRGPRKPSHGYSLTAAGHALFPRQYDAILNAVLQDVREGSGSRELTALFGRLGRRLAAEHAQRFAGLSPQERVAEALALLGELGGAATVVPGPAEGQLTIVGTSCPLGAVVGRHPECCGLLEAFLAEVLPGSNVHEACHKDTTQGPPHCRFQLSPHVP
jgi:DeoR family transcriptional regulator, suf operon transcriptional repressor